MPAVSRRQPTAISHPPVPAGEDLIVQFTGSLLCGDRAVRCDPPIAAAPHFCLRAVAMAAAPTGCPMEGDQASQLVGSGAQPL